MCTCVVYSSMALKAEFSYLQKHNFCHQPKPNELILHIPHSQKFKQCIFYDKKSKCAQIDSSGNKMLKLKNEICGGDILSSAI